MGQLIDFRIKPPVRDTDADPAVELGPLLDRYDDVYGMRERFNTPFDALEAEMEQFGIKGIMQAEFEESGRSRYWNERVAELVGRRPDLFLGGLAGVDPREPDALDELEWAHDELGLRGLVIQPGFLKMTPTDERCYPLYSYCQRRGVPVTLHTGINFTPNGPIDYGRPLWVDRVACDFPDLVLVCNHGGWPWVTEALAIAWKHTNVYLEFGAIAPKYLADPRGGWQPLTHWMRTQVKENILLATDWPMLRYERLVDELPLLELPPEVADAYTHGNAQRIIDRAWAPATA
ncbi:MAG TPA: amidohydrolase family protein [Solirubrobacterales bacterium]|nr:amidohydrolase family protein [Solirubrobacterales bacterium]